MNKLLVGYLIATAMMIVVYTVLHLEPSGRTILAAITIWGATIYFKEEKEPPCQP